MGEGEQAGCPPLLLREDPTQWLAPTFIPSQGTHGKKVREASVCVISQK